MTITIGSVVRVRYTGDMHIDRHADQVGRIEGTRTINDAGYRYLQVLIVTNAGDRVWVNENEYDMVEEVA